MRFLAIVDVCKKKEKKETNSHKKKYNLTSNTTKRMINIWISKKINHIEVLEIPRI